jgi:hypothetical protein
MDAGTVFRQKFCVFYKELFIHFQQPDPPAGAIVLYHPDGYRESYLRMDTGTLFRIIKYRNGVTKSKELKGCKNKHYHFCKKILVNLICISGYIRYSPVPEL